MPEAPPPSSAPLLKHPTWRTRCEAAWDAVCSLVRRPRSASALAPDKAAPKDAPAPSADTLRAYRHGAATHLYTHNAARIYCGMLPPQLYAIGVLNVSIDHAGQVLHLHWLRAPGHAPEVVAEIERTVRAAAPFPRPAGMEQVVYTDTWLWDASGSFQLDTLTEGQL